MRTLAIRFFFATALLSFLLVASLDTAYDLEPRWYAPELTTPQLLAEAVTPLVILTLLAPVVAGVVAGWWLGGRSVIAAALGIAGGSAAATMISDGIAKGINAHAFAMGDAGLFGFLTGIVLAPPVVLATGGLTVVFRRRVGSRGSRLT